MDYFVEDDYLGNGLIWGLLLFFLEMDYLADDDKSDYDYYYF